MAEELKTLEEGYESLAAALKAKQEWQRKVLEVVPLAEGEPLDAVVDRITLLLWLHAEAVHEKAVAYSLMETVNQAATRAVDEARVLAEKRLVAREDWKARCLAAESSRQAWAEEAARLATIIETQIGRFEAQALKADEKIDEHPDALTAEACWRNAAKWLRKAYAVEDADMVPVCVCVTAEQAAQIESAGPLWSVPQCAVHPDGDAA